MKRVSSSVKNQMLKWYEQNARPLPWRENRDPYRIWISETMLQQTTTAAVKPYFEKFLQRFPTVQKLASAPQEEVLELWAGLGYYSRAKNLHKAAQILAAQKSFPKSYVELKKLPGFGDYTSRAVSSIAFGENVGVLDGNVIRFLSRYFNQPFEWWKTKEKKLLQNLADDWVKNKPSQIMNQALMELGATICAPKNPKCLLCPVMKSCSGLKNLNHLQLPIKKERPKTEIWLWQPLIVIKNKKMILQKNKTLPFLKNEWLPPGSVKKIKKPIKNYDFRHGITRYDIYVKIRTAKKQRLLASLSTKESRWVALRHISKIAPFSLMTKTLKCFEMK